jgi:hypothetical protein
MDEERRPLRSRTKLVLLLESENEENIKSSASNLKKDAKSYKN